MKKKGDIFGERHSDYGYEEPVPYIQRKVGDKKTAISANAMIPLLNRELPIRMFRGPAERLRLTAEKTKKNLEDVGFIIIDIVVADELDEVKNFSWSLFKPLITGGEVNGMGFAVNEKYTNPDNLIYPQYFVQRATEKIPECEKKRWPVSYRQKIEGLEAIGSIKARMASFLESLKNNLLNGEQVVFFTHDALLIGIMEASTEGKKYSLEPAGFIHLSLIGDRLIAKRVCDTKCDIIVGNSNIDIIEALRK